MATESRYQINSASTHNGELDVQCAEDTAASIIQCGSATNANVSTMVAH
ncbi:MAG: hypothetical protein GY935_03115 [Gammaproteobacteria bacterium]|nr:hypothetical protein [Gammaproteobacteria bacterium]